jgi:hypothetical protein
VRLVLTYFFIFIGLLSELLFDLFLG